MGGWVESDRYTCVRPSVTMRYRVGGWVKNGRFWRYVIMQCPLMLMTEWCIYTMHGKETLPMKVDDMGHHDMEHAEIISWHQILKFCGVQTLVSEKGRHARQSFQIARERI